MTFYEAALRILESEGRPLHFLEITEKSIAQNLLSHIGKTPEKTMLSRLAAMARRTRDRRVVVTAKDTFALVDWAIPEDLEALAQTGLPEPHPEEALPPLRPVERHPEPRNENARALGRGERKRRRDEDEEGGRAGRRRRFPPIPDVAFEILSEENPSLDPKEIIGLARERDLAGDELTTEQLLMALLEDNQKRIDAGRRPQFVLSKESGALSLEKTASDVPSSEVQAVFAQTLGIPMENGRPVLAKPAAAAAPVVAEGVAAAEGNLVLAAKNAVKEARRALAKTLRAKLASLDACTFEKSVVRMMQSVGFRELKVAKRSKEGPLLTTRRREGSVELRFAVRMLKGSPSIDRKMVQDLRRDLGHYSAQVGLLVSAGDVRGDARSEAQSSGALVMLWCGDALGEKFLEARTAVTVTQVELFEVDEQFFETARVDAEEAQKRREERQKEKAQREDGGEKPEKPEKRERRERGERPERTERPERAEADESSEVEVSATGEADREPAVAEASAPVPAAPGIEAAEGADDEEGDDEEGDEEGGEEGGAQAQGGVPGQPGAQPGERKRRRRRRRGRRGRGQREGGQPGAPGAAGAPGAPGAPAAAGAPGAPAGEGGGAAAAPPPASEAAPSAPPPASEAAPSAPPPASEAAPSEPPPPPLPAAAPEGGEGSSGQ